MEWLTALRTSINYMEHHLEEDINLDDISNEIYLSPFLFSRGFSLTTGVGVMEYLRNRRLYQAALDLRNTDLKIIDIAFKYCYETAESFTKAFTRFHGSSPKEVRSGASIKVFQPMTISINILGGEKMNYEIKEVKAFKLIGFSKIFENENSYQEVPKYWDDVMAKYMSFENPRNDIEQAVKENGIGEFGICIDNIDSNHFRYLIAGKYMGGDVPEGLELFELPENTYAIFKAVGPLPASLQSVNTKIYQEWLPGNPEYELDGDISLEWYDYGDTSSINYRSEIWIPVKKK